MADLVFRRPRYTGGAVDLVFGADGGGGETGVWPSLIEGASTLSGIVSSGLVTYDNRNPRRVSTIARMPHQVANRALPDTQLPWGLSRPGLRQERTTWQVAGRAARETDTGWTRPGRIVDQRDVPWLLAVPVSTQAAIVHQAAEMLRAQAVLPWQVAQALHATSRAPHQVGLQVHTDRLVPWQVAARLQALATCGRQVATAAGLTSVWPWDVARVIPPGREVWPPVDPGGPFPPRVPDLNLLFACPPWAGGPVNLVFGRVCVVRPPEPGATVVVPIRSVYMTYNTILLRRVVGDITLPASAFSMSIDVDSWTWSWSATVQGAALALLAPDAGEPVEIEVVINGVPYRLLSEDVSRTRRFGENSLSVSGRGLSAAIDAPHAPVMNFSNGGGALTAQQIALAALTLNGEGIGWGIDWGLTDWLVPAGSWSHQGTHMSAVNAIAAAAGGYVQPHPTARTLRVLPRYPVAPWDWSDVTPDFELPSAPVVVEGIQWVKRPAYNRIYVSGQGQGVLGRVTRAGTAGDVEAPMVVDALITHADVARQRGLKELGDTGNQAMVSLSLPVLGATGLILPGRFVRYVDGADQRLGLVRSTSVDWQRPRLRQSITLETHLEA
jgi:hypothetical protein